MASIGTLRSHSAPKEAIASKSKENQDICLKFSAFVLHMFEQIWLKHFDPNSNSLPATAHFGQNFERL